MPRKRSEKEKEENRKTYLYYKSHHICTSCHCRPARPGRTKCEICADRDRRCRKRKKKQETAAQWAARSVRENTVNRARHHRYKREGRCPICGKRVKPPNVYCIDCRLRRRRDSRRAAARRKKKHDDNPARCCRCDAPALPGKRLCRKHYEITLAALVKTRASEGYKNMLKRKHEKYGGVKHETNIIRDVARL